MKSLNIETQVAKVSKVNPRAEFHGDEKEIAMDLSIKFECSIDVLKQLSIHETDPDYDSLLYDFKGKLFDHGLSEIHFNRVYENHKLIVSYSGVFTDEQAKSFDITKIKSIKAKPMSGRIIELSMKVQLLPDEDEIAFLTESIAKAVYVGIEGPTQLDFVEAELKKARESEYIN